jgi:hypothetical protein
MVDFNAVAGCTESFESSFFGLEENRSFLFYSLYLPKLLAQYICNILN